MKKTIVVTGAFGYIGLALIRRLAGVARVVAVGHPPRARVTLPEGVVAIEGDARLAVGPLREGADALVHLAGGGGEGAVRADPVRAVDAIVDVTTELVDASRAAETRRVLFASTIAVYGTHRVHPRPYQETDDLLPDDLYGMLKRAAERIVTSLGEGTALRLANVYGAGFGVDLGIQGAAERFARAAARGDAITIHGDGSQRLDYVHVDDVVEAFLRALDADALPPAINIGGGHPVTIRALAETFVEAGRALGTSPRLTAIPAPADKVWPDRSLAIDLAASRLNWAPRVELARGVCEVVEMMR